MLEEKKEKYYSELRRLGNLIEHVDDFENIMKKNKNYFNPPIDDEVYQLLLKAKEEVPIMADKKQIAGQPDWMMLEILELINSMENRTMKKETYEKFNKKDLKYFIDYLEDKFDLPFFK